MEAARKNKALLVLLMIMVAVTFVVAWTGREKPDPAVDKLYLKSVDLKSIDEVILKGSSGEREVRLSYQGSRWKVNDSLNAEADMIDILFATLQQAEPKRPLSGAINDSISKILESKGVEVSLRSQGQAALSFFAGGNESKTQSYFKKKGESMVYIMTIPGYRVYVSGIFELKANDWRNKNVFAFNWRNFKTLRASFKKSEGNFTVAFNDQYFGIEGVHEVDTSKLNTYLDQVSLLKVDAFASVNKSLDSLGKTQPLCTITVEDIGKKQYSLEIFDREAGQQVYGRINHREWALFNTRKIIPILRPKEFFAKR
jgi:hypothetical protein